MREPILAPLSRDSFVMQLSAKHRFACRWEPPSRSAAAIRPARCLDGLGFRTAFAAAAGSVRPTRRTTALFRRARGRPQRNGAAHRQERRGPPGGWLQTIPRTPPRPHRRARSQSRAPGRGLIALAAHRRCTLACEMPASRAIVRQLHRARVAGGLTAFSITLREIVVRLCSVRMVATGITEGRIIPRNFR